MSGLTKAALLVLAALVVAYVAWVAHFEWKLGRDQPQGPTSLVIVTTKSDGSNHDRVLSRLVDDDGSLYVAVNHWPRAWYRQALANPQVQITMDGETGEFLAVPMEGPQHDYLMERFPLRFRSRLQMGFPPRYFLRLEPAGRAPLAAYSHILRNRSSGSENSTALGSK
ncbi:MAG: nitroreductase/quinone reductase family protein [Pseudomonadales bacterium]